MCRSCAAPSHWATCWLDVRQEHAHPDPAVANSHILEDLNGGDTSIDLRLDGAAMHGRDADNPHAAHRCKIR
jgi:methylmalonyl-CoA mutase